MNILVLGAGAIGGIVGGRLAKSGADVTFLVRKEKKQDIDREGLHIESPYGDLTIQVQTCLDSEIDRQFDLVLLSCKAYDLASALTSIKNAVGEQTCILPILNGIAHMDVLNSEFGKQRVLGGSIKMQATVTPKGVVRQLSDWQTLTFGEQGGRITPRVKQIETLLENASIKARPTQDVLRSMWMKLVHLATVAGMTCLMRANVGEIARTPEGSQLMCKFLRINASIAMDAGYPPDDEFVASYTKLFHDATARYEASMLRDLERGGRIEAEEILGDMLRRCRSAGLDDALHCAAYTHAKAYEQRRDARRLPTSA